MTIKELREKRKKAWDTARDFLDSKRNANGVLSEEDSKTYDAMEQTIVDLGKEIQRLERQAEIEAEMNKATSTPVLGKPAAPDVTEKTGTASDTYKKAFWNSVRNRNWIDVHDDLHIGTDAEGGYLVPDEFERKLAYIAKEFARRIGAKEEEAFFVGDGKGKPTGIFNATGGAENGTSITGASITFDDVMELFYSLRSPYRKKAVWVLNDSTVKALRKLKDNTGNYIWNPSVQAGVPDTILNRPYKTSSYVPEIKAGNKCMAFGDFSYYWVADRQGRSFKRLNELFAMTGQVGFLASQRLDGKLILPEAIKTLTIKKA